MQTTPQMLLKLRNYFLLSIFFKTNARAKSESNHFWSFLQLTRVSETLLNFFLQKPTIEAILLQTLHQRWNILIKWVLSKNYLLPRRFSQKR